MADYIDDDNLWKEDLYATLGVANNVSDSDLKKAYLKLAKQYHPDRFPEDNQEKLQAQRLFSKITVAYDTLSDPKKKAHYLDLRRLLANHLPENQPSLTNTSPGINQRPPGSTTSPGVSQSGVNISNTSPGINQRPPGSTTSPGVSQSGVNISNTSPGINRRPPGSTTSPGVTSPPLGNTSAGSSTLSGTLSGAGISAKLSSDLRKNMDQEKGKAADKVKSEQAKNLFSQGLELYKKKELDKSIALFKQAIAMRGDIAEYHSQLGLAYQVKGWTGMAQAEFKIALKFDPDDKNALKALNDEKGGKKGKKDKKSDKSDPATSENKGGGIMAFLKNLKNKKLF